MRLNKDGDTDLYTKDRWSSRLGAWVSASEWKPEFPPVARVSVPVPPAPTSRPALATAFKNELRNALAVFRPSRAQASVETITAACWLRLMEKRFGSIRVPRSIIASRFAVSVALNARSTHQIQALVANVCALQKGKQSHE
jgi:hypothetical protein